MKWFKNYRIVKAHTMGVLLTISGWLKKEYFYFSGFLKNFLVLRKKLKNM